MKVLVIGGNGFIGTYIVKKLRDEKCHITVFDRSTNRFMPELEGVKYIYGNFEDLDSLKITLQNVDIVYHLISTTVPATADNNTEFDVESNLIGTLRLLEVLSEYKIKKFIFASSGGTVYGNPKYLPIDEEHPLNPICSYGIVKVAIEKYVQMYAKKMGFSFLIIRPSNPFGPYQSYAGMQGVISTFLYKVLRGETLTVWGDGSAIRDYIYITDVADFFVVAGLSDKEGIFNLGYGIGYSVNDIITHIHRITGLKANVKYIKADSFNVNKVILDISKAYDTFAWKPNISLEDGLTIHYEWMKDMINKEIR